MSLALLGCGGTSEETEQLGEVSQDLVTTSTCSGLPSCSLYANQRCSERIGTRLDCCRDEGWADYLVCSSWNGQKYWLYE
ncbi:MAG: hypothetical protein JXB05_26275 [Myxococcaceae bacterium]|nr:hypothetical protein [Myxococcaceae bacterium]